MYKNYKELIDDLEILAMNHKQVNSFGFGDIRQISYFTESRKKGISSQVEENQEENYKTAIYPLIYVVPQPVNHSGRDMTISFNVLVMDIIKKDYSNERQVFSDTLQIAEDLISAFRYGDLYSKYDAVLPSQLLPFSESFDDFVDGWNINLQVRVEAPLDRCIAPFEEDEILLKEDGDAILQENKSKILL